MANINGLNAMLFSVKKINGNLYRINNIAQNINNTFESKVDNYTKQINEFKLINITKDILNNDDATSDDDYSQNISYVSDESDKSMVDEVDNTFLDIDTMMISNIEEKNNFTRISSKLNKWTHFLSIPLFNNKDFIDKYEYMKMKMLENCDIKNEYFQKPHRLHMTICLLSISDDEMKRFMNVLNETYELIKTTDELYLDFNQLEIFGSPHKSRVLYTRPDPINSEKYKDIIDIIISKLIENKFITNDMMTESHIYLNKLTERYENEKAHVTLINSSFTKNRENFNGLKLIKRMTNFSFGVHKISEIHLNEMKIGKDDKYIINTKYLI